MGEREERGRATALPPADPAQQGRLLHNRAVAATEAEHDQPHAGGLGQCVEVRG